MWETERIKLAHELRAPSDEVDIVPGVHSTLLSGVKFSDSDYVTMLDKEGIIIYDENNQNHHLRKVCAQWLQHKIRIMAHPSE